MIIGDKFECRIVFEGKDRERKLITKELDLIRSSVNELIKARLADLPQYKPNYLMTHD